jgi:hypothetical protein
MVVVRFLGNHNVQSHLHNGVSLLLVFDRFKFIFPTLTGLVFHIVDMFDYIFHLFWDVGHLLYLVFSEQSWFWSLLQSFEEWPPKNALKSLSHDDLCVSICSIALTWYNSLLHVSQSQRMFFRDLDDLFLLLDLHSPPKCRHWIPVFQTWKLS